MGMKRVLKGLCHRSKKTSASKSASTASGTVLQPALKKPLDTTNVVQDAAVRDLWSLALGKLSLEDGAAVSAIGSDLKLDILRHLNIAAEKKRNDCEARRWKFEFKGRQIILRDVAEKIITWVEKFKEIGDIAASFDPVHASLPWAGVRFLLEIAVADNQQMGALLTGVERITFLISRCQIFEAFYLGREQFDQEDWKQAVVNLTSALVTLYAAMLTFLGSAIRAYNQSAIIRTLCAIWDSNEVTAFLDKCQELEDKVTLAVGDCDRIYTHHIQASTEEHIQRLKQILNDLQTPILRTDSRVAALFEKQEKSERQSILEWISGIHYEDNHQFARQGRTSGTGEWLLQDERYREWRASSASMILWLHGDPGAGKTKLVSTVVDHLLKTFKQHSNDEGFAYFYCDRNQSDRRDPALILRSFVRQLSTPRNNEGIPHSTVQMYNQKQQTASQMLISTESQAVLAELFQIFPQVTLVVDALDECDKKTRTGFIAILDELIAESPKPVKILISSRQDGDIKGHFEDGPNLEIRAVDNRDDIAAFVKHEIAASGKFWPGNTSSDLKTLICNTLVDKSEGMFQWVALQIVELRELPFERDIRDRLGKLPKTLKIAYDELYHKIQSQEGNTSTIANRAFQWVMCSCWPLSPAELVAAVCQDPDTDEIDEVHINSINEVLIACQNLLAVDQQLNACRFSHLSVQEYFETHHWSPCETNCLVGKVCLSFLIYNSTTPKQDVYAMKKEDKDKSAYDILEYACLEWVTHVQRLEEKGFVENRLTVLLKEFLGSMDQSSPAYQNWHKMVGRYFDNFSFSHSQIYLEPLYQSYKRLSPCSRASLAIVTFGFYKLILDWWTFGFADINQKNSSGYPLLLLGAMGGSISITQDLLEKGADISTAGGEYGSALQAASFSGHESVVQLLLKKGADINASDGAYGNALSAASSSGRESVVQLLLDKGAEVNASGGSYGSALQAASDYGRESVVQLLLDKGAEVNASGGNYGSALCAAASSGRESVVRLLLNHGADVNASGGYYGSALQAASYSGVESLVKLLLDKGADVNAKGGRYGSALQAASDHGRESVVQLLLDKGADVNSSGGSYGSALDIASSNGHEALVKLLQTAMKPQ